MELINNIEKLFEQIADGMPSTQRFSTYPASIAEKGIKVEGGKAFKSSEGVILATKIKREYVPTTLKQVYHTLERIGIIDVESAQPLGSTLYLSKPLLGDLDILIKPSQPVGDLAAFKNTLYDWFYLQGFTVRDLADKGRDFLYDEFSFLHPIIDDNNQTTQEMVQVDLILAENQPMYQWRYYWYAAPKTSAWKGAARNVLLGVISAKLEHSWTKNGLFQKQVRQYAGDWEESALVTDCPFEAVKVIFGENADISVIDSVESMLQALDTQTKLIPLKDSILTRFGELVKTYEEEGREMRNEITHKDSGNTAVT